uniref:Uncharacterized protein n=1 Tax=Anguilla anguilla TaxID=7936 RepID=A0A0E9WQR1_ANGAN
MSAYSGARPCKDFKKNEGIIKPTQNLTGNQHRDFQKGAGCRQQLSNFVLVLY